MIELRKALAAYLEAIHPRVYFQSALKGSEFPYLVYDFPSTIDDGETLETVVVDIDGWDKEQDTTVLETLMSSVNSGLNKKTLTAGNTTAVFYVDIKLSLTDVDPRIRRRKYTYQAKLFRRG